MRTFTQKELMEALRIGKVPSSFRIRVIYKYKPQILTPRELFKPLFSNN